MSISEQMEGGCVRPMIQVGSELLDAECVFGLNTADVLNLARIARRREVSEKALQRIRDLCPGLVPSEKKLTALPATPVIMFIDEIIRIRKFPAETRLEVNYILGVGMFASLAVD